MPRHQTDLSESLFANPVWHALHTEHRHFAISAGMACRYPAGVAPFAALAEPTTLALQHLYSILAPGESVFLLGDYYPQVPELSFGPTLECVQMVLRDEITPPDLVIEIVPLSHANAAEMVALTDLAFPGFFRSRTCEMGTYYGIRSNTELIAMGGERLVLEGYREISGVCTHPSHRGQGHAASLIWQLVRDHRRAGLVSWLHVAGSNKNAIDLYLRMGFIIVRNVTLHRISRSISTPA